MIDIAHLRTWIGRAETVTDRADAAQIEGLVALLDRDTPPWNEGEAPPLSHWLYFLARVRESGLGGDGHPRRGGFLPPVELPRRMFAGAQIAFHAPVPLGVEITRTSKIENVEAKTGKSGSMVFVTVRHEIAADGAPALTEIQNIVYRDAPKGAAAAPPPEPDPRKSEITRTVRPDPVLLFRYSALTFNAHRVHYDRSYCREVEGYPGLVVHGPLIATLLMDHFLRAHPKARVKSFSFRAQRPLFDTAPFDLCLARTAKGAELWARNEAGEAAVTSVLETA